MNKTAVAVENRVTVWGTRNPPGKVHSELQFRTPPASHFITNSLKTTKACTKSPIGFAHWTTPGHQHYWLTWSEDGNEAQTVPQQQLSAEELSTWAGCLLTGNAAIVNDYHQFPGPNGHGNPTNRIHRLLTTAVKITSDSHLILGVANKDGAYIAHDAEHLNLVAEITAHALSAIEQVQTNCENTIERSQRLETIGTLATGIAHDFNNILTVMSGYSAFLNDSGDQKAIRDEATTALAKAIDRAAGLTRQLLHFGRTTPADFKNVQINDIITDIAKLLNRVLPENICLETRLARNLQKLRADPGMLEQVITNLVVNARDALKNRTPGSIVIETRATQNGICISVADNGSGIPAEIINRIFDPFFTTKPAGAGTGLGLAICKTIIEKHQGNITVNSAPGQGTRFDILLPAAENAELANGERETERMEHGEGRILVSEPNREVGKIFKAVLNFAGFDVQTTGSMDESLLQLASPFPFSAIILDLQTPGVVSVENLVGSIHAQHPGLPIILIGDQIPEEPWLKAEHTLAKPVNWTALSRLLKNSPDLRK